MLPSARSSNHSFCTYARWTVPWRRNCWLGKQKPNRGSASVVVGGYGRGIPADLLDRVAEPFFTTKAVGKGTGLGLGIIATVLRSSQAAPCALKANWTMAPA